MSHDVAIIAAEAASHLDVLNAGMWWSRMLRSIVHMGCRATACALVGALVSGCAAAVPGYIPPSAKAEKKSAFSAKPFESGKVGEGGGYVLSDAEKKLDCRKLTGSQQITLLRLESRKSSAAPSALAQAAQKTSAPILKQSLVGADLQQEIALEHARFKAFNGLLISKGCQPVALPRGLTG